MPERRGRGRERRVPGEPQLRVYVYLSSSELARLRQVASRNGQAISEFLRLAGNDAAEECGEAVIFVDRRHVGSRSRKQRAPRNAGCV
jgi:hypothetical protein